jgi:hypothetical protein
MAALVRVRSVEPKKGFTVEVHFNDGSRREINLEPYLHGPVFEAIRHDPSMFRSMQVEEGAITWPNGADIDPDVLYYSLTPAWAITPESPDSDQLL